MLDIFTKSKNNTADHQQRFLIKYFPFFILFLSSMNQPKNSAKPLSQWRDFFNLTTDQAHPDMIDNAIRSNVRVSGTNLWVLMFAIAIASIGLNVNSTAVIIGAMLISPLMGPIVGIGYGAAVSDVRLIKLSVRNIFIFIAISLFTSTLYFLITPLQEAQSELLARTTPTLWDVLIAFFGGSAGIVALTRKEVSNVVPGVAIATALMPPLCTAGYGLAHGDWHYFFGAFYLFAINCVFIAFSTLIFSRLLKLPKRGLVSKSKQRLHNLVIYAVVLAVMLPSGFLAYRLVQKEIFFETVNTVTQNLQKDEKFFTLHSTIDEKQQSVRLVIGGRSDVQYLSDELSNRLVKAGIKEPNVQILYTGGDTQNMQLVKKELESSHHNTVMMQNQLEKQQAYIDELLSKQTQKSSTDLDQEAILKEIQAQYPDAQKIAVANAKWLNMASSPQATSATQLADGEIAEMFLVVLQTNQAPTKTEKARLKAWLTQRLKGEVELIIKDEPVTQETTQ